jgi:hypothetical protein
LLRQSIRRAQDFSTNKDGKVFGKRWLFFDSILLTLKSTGLSFADGTRAKTVFEANALSIFNEMNHIAHLRCYFCDGYGHLSTDKVPAYRSKTNALTLGI